MRLRQRGSAPQKLARGRRAQETKEKARAKGTQATDENISGRDGSAFSFKRNACRSRSGLQRNARAAERQWAERLHSKGMIRAEGTTWFRQRASALQRLARMRPMETRKEKALTQVTRQADAIPRQNCESAFSFAARRTQPQGIARSIPAEPCDS